MQLEIDKKPKLYSLRFATLRTHYAEATSPRSIITQSGIEFDHFRQYQPSDDARLIDWVASARTDEMLVRVFTENTSVNILLMLDVSESMIYGTSKKAKIEFAIELALNISYGVLNYGDSIGLILFNTKVIRHVPFRNGLQYYPEIEENLVNTDGFGGPVELSLPLAFSLDMFKGTHMVLFISDFLGFGDSLYSGMNSVANNFDMIGIMVNDKTDLELDSGVGIVGLQDPYSAEHRFVRSGHLKQKYAEENKKRISGLQNFFNVIGKDLWVLRTDDRIEKKIPRLLERRNSMRV